MAHGNSGLSKQTSLLTRAKYLSAALGTAALAYWWVAISAEGSPQKLFLLWLTGLSLWALALLSIPKVKWPDHADQVALVILMLAVIPRTVWLSQAPYQVPSDEVLYAEWGRQILREDPWGILSKAGGSAVPYLVMVLTSWGCLFFEPLLGARFSAVVLGMGSLMATYALARRLFGPWTAVLALALLAAAHWHIAASRTAYPVVQATFFPVLALYLLVRGFQNRGTFSLFAGGAALGLTLLVYTPARIAIPVFAVWVVHRVITGEVDLRQAARDCALVILGTGIILAPYLRTNGWTAVFQRYGEVSVEGSGTLAELSRHGWDWSQQWHLISERLNDALRVYYGPGGVLSPHDIVRTAMLEPLTAGLALMGLCIAVVKIRDSSFFLLLLWIVGTLLAAQVLTDMPEGAYRSTVMLPAIAILAARTATLIGQGCATVVRSQLLAGAAVGAVFLGVVLPWNIAALNDYFEAHSVDPVGAIGRFIGSYRRDPIYYFLGMQPLLPNPVIEFFADGRDIVELQSPMDSLGVDVDVGRDAVFVMDDDIAGSATAVRRCYPGSIFLNQIARADDSAVIALGALAPTLLAGRHCAANPQGPGLRARYFSGPEWNGNVTLERVEEVPLGSRKWEEPLGSAIWSGFLSITVPGSYSFQLISNGAVCDAKIGSLSVPADSAAYAVDLRRARHPITIRCRPMNPGGVCQLLWRPLGGGLQSIPSTALTPDG